MSDFEVNQTGTHKALDAKDVEIERLRAALVSVRDHWPTDPDDYVEGVQEIAREALATVTDGESK